MNIAEIIKIAVATLLANKLRSNLTMLGMIIGNASVIAMIGVGQGAQKSATKEFESLGPNMLFVVPGSSQTRNTNFDNPRTLVLEDAKAIAAQVPSVKKVAPQINSRKLLTYRNKNAKNQVIGTTPAFLSVRSVNVAKGRFITDIDLKRNNQVVVLGAKLVKKIFNNQDPIGKQVRIENVSFQVVGVMASKGSLLEPNQNETFYMPLTTMSNRLIGRTSPYGVEVSLIAVSAKNEDSIRAAQFQIGNLLRLRHKITGEDDFSIQAQKDILQTVNTIAGSLTIMLVAIAGISLLVGGIGIMNTMLVSVTERTQEIGLRKAIGATQQDILFQFTVEAVLLSVAGSLLGTALGVSSILLIGRLTPLATFVSPVAIVLAVSVSGGIGLFFGVTPARRAAQLDPIVALRSA